MITLPRLPKQMLWPSIPPLINELDVTLARNEREPTFQAEPPTCARHWAVIYDKYDPDFDTHPVVWSVPRRDMLSVEWSRERDNPAGGSLVIGYSAACQNVLADLKVIRHNVGIYREGILVYFGVITRIEYEESQVEIYLEDYLWFMRRRVLTPGYIHSGLDGKNGIDHCNEILWSAFGIGGTNRQGMVTPSEPYIQPVLQTDSEESGRSVNNWQISVWQDLSHHARYTNIDYTTFGKAIYFWDFNTRWPALDLPDLGENDISTFPRVTQYGNNSYTRAIRSDGSGYAGIFDEASTGSPVVDDYYRNIDYLMTNSDPADREGPPAPETLANWERVARKTLSNRLPPQELVAIPDGSTLMPTCEWDVNLALAGSWFTITVMRAGRLVNSLLRLQSLIVRESGEEAEQVIIRTTTAPDDWVTP